MNLYNSHFTYFQICCLLQNVYVTTICLARKSRVEISRMFQLQLESNPSHILKLNIALPIQTFFKHCDFKDVFTTRHKFCKASDNTYYVPNYLKQFSYKLFLNNITVQLLDCNWNHYK